MNQEQLDKYDAWEAEQMEKHGWIAHMVGPSCQCGACGEHDMEGDPDSPTRVNYHTHGLTNYDHMDLQIVLPLNPKDAMGIFRILADLIKIGTKIEAGTTFQGPFQMPLSFQRAIEADDHEVLRVIIPDKDGKIEQQEMDPAYAIQWEGLAV